MTTDLTTRERELARHALGLNDWRKRSYRNHYVVGECDDHTIWLGMATRGLARRFRGNQLTGGDDLFRLTRPGAEAALGPGEELDSEDFPR
jgi:hypothetical protein